MESAAGEAVVRRLFASQEAAAREALLGQALSAIRSGDILARSRATAVEWRERALRSLSGLGPGARGERASLEEIAAFVVDRGF